MKLSLGVLVTVSATGMVNAVAAGAATLTMTYPFAQTTQFNGFDCTTTVSAVSDSAPVQVCDFSISGTASAICDDTTKNKATFVANPLPNSQRCPVNGSASNLTFSVSGPATADYADSSQDFTINPLLIAFYFAGKPDPMFGSPMITLDFTIAFLDFRNPVRRVETRSILCQ